MKKAIIASLLVSVLAGGAFAQVTFSGSVYAGIQLQNPEDEDETVTTTHRDGYPPRFDFAATVTRENYGARLDTRSQFVEGEGEFAIRGIHGWVNFDGLASSNDSLRLSIGRFADGVWVANIHSSLPEFQLDNDMTGFRLDYSTPIDGLSVGAAFRATGHYLERFAKNAIFGITYIHPMFNAVFAYDLSANVNALFGFNFTGIPDLTASLQLRANRIASWDDPPIAYPGSLEMYQLLGYRIARPLFVYLIAGQTFSGVSGSDVGMEFTPGIEYRFLPNLLGSFSITVESPDYFNTTNLMLRPSIEYTLRGPAMLYAEYELRLDNMDRATHTFGFGITIRAF
ncbi:MAG: hypothetical protein FWC64_06565 [Treponema sp.]|nr:hypothetical protein [Treponema sp.]